MSTPLDIIRISATTPPSAGIRTLPIVTKLIDTSTCIGCKACEVACQEWNDLPPETTVQMGTYQTLPETTSNLWNLIKFNEHESEQGFHWLMRKDQCMHCTEPGCLIACPAPGAIVPRCSNTGCVAPRASSSSCCVPPPWPAWPG